MKKSSEATLSRAFLGVLVLGALMSAVFVKVFADLALAEELVPEDPEFGRGAEILGHYRVADIQQHSRSYTGSICAPHADARGEQRAAHRHCGQDVMAIRKGAELILLQAGAESDDGEWLHSFLLSGAFGANGCKTSVLRSKLKDGVFQTRLCRAHAGAEPGAFQFPRVPDVEGAAGGMAAASTAAIGIPLGAASSHAVRLEGDLDSPARIVIDQLNAGIVILPAQIRNSFILDRTD